MNTNLSNVQKTNLSAETTTKFHPPSLGLRISERKLLLATGDLALLNLTIFISLHARPDLTINVDNFWVHLPWLLLASGLWALAATFLDLYNLPRAANAPLSALHAGSAALVVTAAFLLIPFVTPAFPTRRLNFLLPPLLAAGSIAAWRALYATLIVQPVFQRTALVVGAGNAGRALLQAILNRHGGHGPHGAHGPHGPHGPWQNTVYHVLGFVDDDPHKQQTTIDGVPVLGNRRDLVTLVQQLQPDELILSITHLQQIHNALFQAILDCRELGIAVTTMPALYESITGRVPVQHAGRNIHVILPITPPHIQRFYVTLRRAFDLIIALLGCLFMLLIIPPIWLANRIINREAAPGSLFYRQLRIGKGGHPFHIVKFRSMVPHAEQNTGAVWAQENDPRTTRVGRFLRKTRLDEVPQFWNVLKGDMSLFGPRPERPAIVRRLSRQIPYYRMRHAVRPGITGWAQIKHTYAATVHDALIKLQYDLYYIKHQGPYLDLLILLQTIKVVLHLKGR